MIGSFPWRFVARRPPDVLLERSQTSSISRLVLLRVEPDAANVGQHGRLRDVSKPPRNSSVSLCGNQTISHAMVPIRVACAEKNRDLMGTTNPTSSSQGRRTADKPTASHGTIRVMPRYRAYVFDEHGQLVGAVDFDCADDDEAKERVRRFDHRHVELWRELPLGGDSKRSR